MGICPQETALYPSATVIDHLRLFGALAGLRAAVLRRAVDDIVERMDLVSVTGKPAGLLSGGQRKRTQAATALIADRPLLLLDEPTVGADPMTRSKLLAVVADRAAAGAAVVYTTHYLPELTELGASVAVAEAGRIDSIVGERVPEASAARIGSSRIGVVNHALEHLTAERIGADHACIRKDSS